MQKKLFLSRESNSLSHIGKKPFEARCETCEDIELTSDPMHVGYSGRVC